MTAEQTQSPARITNVPPEVTGQPRRVVVGGEQVPALTLDIFQQRAAVEATAACGQVVVVFTFLPERLAFLAGRNRRLELESSGRFCVAKFLLAGPNSGLTPLPISGYGHVNRQLDGRALFPRNHRPVALPTPPPLPRRGVEVTTHQEQEDTERGNPDEPENWITYVDHRISTAVLPILAR
jgi:hypothetical protein